jgi:hypothetical protein
MRARAPCRCTYSTRQAAASATVLPPGCRAGTTINDTVYHFAQEDLPFGASAASGMGTTTAVTASHTFSHAKGAFLPEPPHADQPDDTRPTRLVPAHHRFLIRSHGGLKLTGPAPSC